MYRRIKFINYLSSSEIDVKVSEFQNWRKKSVKSFENTHVYSVDDALQYYILKTTVSFTNKNIFFLQFLKYNTTNKQTKQKKENELTIVIGYYASTDCHQLKVNNKNRSVDDLKEKAERNRNYIYFSKSGVI